jgi:hypothetical protein
MTQVEALVRHFEKVGSITNVEAQAMYKIRALPRRISDLEARGHKIERQRKVDATGQRYVRYVYAN